MPKAKPDLFIHFHHDMIIFCPERRILSDGYLLVADMFIKMIESMNEDSSHSVGVSHSRVAAGSTVIVTSGKESIERKEERNRERRREKPRERKKERERRETTRKERERDEVRESEGGS